MNQLREKIAAVLDELCDGPDTQPNAAADRIIALIRDPDLDDCPRYKAGEYSRRNLEAFADDIAAPVIQP